MGIFLKHQQLFNTTANIAKREIKIRYANSFLGSLWFILYPLTFAGITSLVFSLVLNNKINNHPYFLYVFLGFNSWLWFSQTLNHITRSPIYNRELIINNKFPTESVIYGVAFSRIPDYIVGIFFCYLISIISKQHINFSSILIIIATSFIQLMLQVGLGLIAATINVFARDFQNIIEILLQLLFYVTPIIYSTDILPEELHKFIELNPMARQISIYRNAFFQNQFYFNDFLYVLIASLVIFTFGIFIYKKNESKFTEIL